VARTAVTAKTKAQVLTCIVHRSTAPNRLVGGPAPRERAPSAPHHPLVAGCWSIDDS
jgi:hypothetical protein